MKGVMKLGEPLKSDLIPPTEGPSLEFTRDRLQLVLQLNGVTEEEAIQFQRTRHVELGLFSKDQILFFLIRIPGLLEWSDAPYSLSTFSKDLWPEEKTNGGGPRLRLNLMLVELRNRALLASHELLLSENFSQELLALINTQRATSVDGMERLKQIHKIQKRNPAEKMVKKAYLEVIQLPV